MTHRTTGTRRRSSLLAAILLAALPAWSCVENEGGPMDPSQIPQVAGNYSGTIVAVLPEKGETITCSVSTSVTQSGSTVTVAPAVFGQACQQYEIPGWSAPIATTGAIPVTVSGTFENPECGTYNFTVSGGFDGQTLNVSATLTSPTCDDANLTLVMNRQ